MENRGGDDKFPPTMATRSMGTGFQKRTISQKDCRVGSLWPRLAVLLSLGAIFAIYPVSGAFGAEPIRWVTGAALQQRLAQPVRCSWPGVPLRQALQSLSRAERLAVLIDRRIDPGQKLQLQLDAVPLKTALHDIAEHRRLGVSMLGPVAYYGPPWAATRLRTISELREEEAQRLPSDVARKLLQPAPAGWEDFAEPRQILEQWARQTGVKIVGLERRIPHDLWAAAELPPMSPVDRLTLVLIQYDLTFQISIDGKSIALVPLPDDVALVRAYRGSEQPEAMAAKFARLIPNARIKVVGDLVYVKGLWEDHHRITSPKPPPRPPAGGNGSDDLSLRRFTLNVKEQPVSAILNTLAKQIGLDMRIDHDALRAAGISLDRRVSFSVHDATLDELLGKVTQPAGLKFTRKDRKVSIRP